MKKRYFIIQLLFLLSLWACNDDDDAQLPGNALRISGTITGMTPGEAVGRFRGGAGVGVFVAGYVQGAIPEELNLVEAKVQNGKFMQSADGLVGDPPITWEDAATVDVVAYYPFRQNMETLPTAASFKIAERQDTLLDSRPAYEESDFLWAKNRADLSTNPVQLTFKHLMSKVVVYLKSDAVIPGDMVGSKVCITGTRVEAEIDLEKGIARAIGMPADIVATEQPMEKTGYELAVKAIVVPQTVGTGTQLLEIKTLGGYSYFYKLTDNLTFEVGKQMTLEVNVESGECHVTVGDITDWTESDSPVLGEAVEDLPVFKLFDYYNLNGIQGMVVSIDETGKHGKVISLDETTFSVWCTNVTLQDETDVDDGMVNLQTILAIDPTLEAYPVMKWCMDKNKEGVKGWYLPASNEMLAVLRMFESDGDLFNEKISAIGGSPILGDPWDGLYYWSSTLSWTGSVRVPKYDYFGVKNALYDQGESVSEVRVRAFYQF